MIGLSKMVPATAAQIAQKTGLDLNTATLYLAVLNEATTANNNALLAKQEHVTIDRRSLHVLVCAFGLLLGLHNIAQHERMLGPIDSGHIE